MSESMFSLMGRTALVTGAAGGIGAAIAAALAGQGADVAVVDRPGVKQDETAARIRGHGRRALAVEMDIRATDQIRKAVQAVLDAFGKIDILVNNAGISRRQPALEVSEDVWDDHFATNVKGGFFLAQAVAPGMIARRFGRVIFVASQSGLIGIPGQTAYCSSKGAVIQLVRALGLEWARQGVTVNAIAPTFVETDLTRQRLQDPEFRGFVLGRIPIGALATADDIAGAAVYLASDDARMVNSAVLSVDGGWTAS